MTVVDLTDFIDASVALAESVEADIQAGDIYTDGTVLALSKFIAISVPVLEAMASLDGADKKVLQ